jgi:hypothetical protein
MLELLIEQYELAKEKVNELYDQLHNTSDGFVYLTKTRSFGSIDWNTHLNHFTAQELCNEYNGDNGVVDVFTNNPNHNIITDGYVKVMSLDEIKDISQTNISKSSAMLKWITGI